MTDVVIYTTKICPYCNMAKELLKSQGIAFTEIRVDVDTAKREEMERLSQRRTVPQIFIHGKPIGGYDELAALFKSKKLESLLNSTN